MKPIKLKLPASVQRYLSLLLLLCLSLGACRDSTQPDPTISGEIGTPQSNSTPGTVLNELPKMPGRRDVENSLAQILGLDMVRASDAPTSLQMPAVIEATVAGRSINSIAMVAGRYEDDGDRRLVTYEPLEPTNSVKAWPIQWPDGIHDLSYVWYTEGDYLGDAEAGDFALLWQIEPGSTLESTNGRFRRVGQAAYVDSVLLVDLSTGEASELLDSKTGEVIVPEPGDQFQLTNLLLDDSGLTITAPGKELTFGESATLRYQRKTLPVGEYFLGFIAEGGVGNADSVFANYSVSNEKLLPDLRAYFQPEYGYQFLYPFTWSEFDHSGKGVEARDHTEKISVQIVVETNSDQFSSSTMKDEAMSSFGDVLVLYEDQIQVDSSSGFRTVYGYESPAGSHTGVLLSFRHDDQVYLVDVDGPSSEEAVVLNVVDTLMASWVWRPVPDNNKVNNWLAYDIDGYRVDIAADLQHNLLENGWHRFSNRNGDGDKFFAIRIEQPEEGDLPERMAYWLEVAGRGIDSLTNSDIYEFQFSDKRWLRVDFQYQDDESGEVSGSILAIDSGADRFVAWFEAPEAEYMQWEENLVSLSLADMFNE